MPWGTWRSWLAAIVIVGAGTIAAVVTTVTGAAPDTGRAVTATAAAATIPEAAPATSGHVTRQTRGSTRPARFVIGYSVDHRPIVAWRFGPANAGRRVLVIGVIHGNETAGLAIVAALRHAPVPAGAALWLVPELNPDGAAAGTRQNAHGVDLNRNFPYTWQYTSVPVYYSGPRPESEPETRAAMAFVRRIRPAVTITYHQHMDLVDMTGGDRGLSRRYAQITGLRATCLTFLPGEETRWSNHTFPGTTSFVVELPAGPVPAAEIVRHVRAVEAMERGQRAGSPTHCDSVTTAS